MSLYLYAILDETNHTSKLSESINTLKLNGMNKQPVQLQSISQFTIVYSKVQEARYLASRANLLAHETVIEAVMKVNEQEVPLPLQFGLVVEDWTEVKQQLIEGHQADLQMLLARLRGKREVGIKLFWDQTAELQLILEENAALNRRRESLMGKVLSLDEAITIGQELESALLGRQQLIISTFLEALQPLSSDYVEGELLTENMLYNAAFLINWDQEPEFAIAVEKLDAEFNHRLRIRYNNFTAPYNFVQLTPVD